MFFVAFATDDVINFWLSPSAKQRQNYLSGPPVVCQGLSTRYVLLVKNAIFDLPIRLMRNLKRVSGNSLSSLGAQNKYFGAALQTLLTKGQFNKACNLQVEPLF